MLICGSELGLTNYGRCSRVLTGAAVSGTAPKEAVCTRNGNIYEKALIEEYIREHGKDPVTGEELRADDLIVLKSSEVHSITPPSAQSIPSLLSAFQNEWDSVALELFELRKQLADTKKELATALYHHDAAVRVAAKAIKERDEAKLALQELSTSIGAGEDDDQEAEDAAHAAQAAQAQQ